MLILDYDTKPVGYEYLIREYNLKTIGNYKKSFIAKHSRTVYLENSCEIHIYPERYLSGKYDDIYFHLRFAIKHEGLNLEILKSLLTKISKKNLEAFIKNSPSGSLARKIWLLYETFTETYLNIPDLKSGSYIYLLNSKEYYTASISTRSKRHRININLLGDLKFSPIIRKTKLLEQFEAKNLELNALNLIERYDPLIIARAMRYLYVKETMSSYAIEREVPDKTRMSNFVDILKKVDHFPSLTKEHLISLQNNIVDSRFAENNYRDFQNYVGEEPALGELLIHYIPPKPEDIKDLMSSWESCFNKIIKQNINPIIQAAAVSFGFVFLHPFEDGNGRLHRFIIHYILSKTNYVPEGGIFPVSATMLKNIKKYDEVLETFSKQLSKIIKKYNISHNGELTVLEETKQYYQFIDYTKIAEFLFSCIEDTIELDFKKELDYIMHYDQVKKCIQNIIDMPDRKIDQIIKFIAQNSGTLSQKKREKYFNMLTENEIKGIEEVIQDIL